MTSCRGHFQAQTGNLLTADICEVRKRRLVVDELAIGNLRPRGIRVECVDHFAQRVRHAYTLPCDAPRLAVVTHRHHRTDIAHGRHHRSDAGDVAKAAVEPEFADKSKTFYLSDRQLTVGSKKPDGDSEIQPGAAFALVRRCEVDGDTARWPHQRT